MSYETETVIPEGYVFPKGHEAVTLFAATIDENYFSAIGTPIVKGRGFLPSDDENAPLVAVVNETFVRHYGIKDPIGARLKMGNKIRAGRRLWVWLRRRSTH